MTSEVFGEMAPPMSIVAPNIMMFLSDRARSRADRTPWYKVFWILHGRFDVASSDILDVL